MSDNYNRLKDGIDKYNARMRRRRRFKRWREGVTNWFRFRFGLFVIQLEMYLILALVVVILILVLMRAM